MTVFRTLLAAGIGLGLLAGAAIGQSADEKAIQAAIKARQAQMDLYAFNLGALGAMAKGEIPYDAAQAGAAAGNLAKLTTLNGMAYWLPGSDNMSADNTRALPAIWEAGSDVGKMARDLAEAAAALETAATTDLAALQAALGPVGQACGACHKAYRAPE